jgi:hypothetical protein
LPVERFLTPAEALGEAVVAKLAQLEDQVLQLDLLVANADLTEKRVQPMDPVAFCAFQKYASEHLEEPLQRPLDGSRWWCWQSSQFSCLRCHSDVHRFVPATTSYVCALAVARLCAQTAQDAIYGFCALCSRTDAGTLASLTDRGTGPGALSRIATRRSTGLTKPSGRSRAYPPRCAARSW